MTIEKQIEILMEDRCTKSEAKKHLKNGTTIFDDFEENFEKYMEEWKYLAEDEEEYTKMVECYKKMIKTGIPVTDWAVVKKFICKFLLAFCFSFLFPFHPFHISKLVVYFYIFLHL